MAEPDRRGVPAEELDERGLDRRGLADTLSEINAVIDEMSTKRQQLAEVEVDGGSKDEEVTVRVTRAGRLIKIRLRDGVIRRYDLDALGELIARTIRETQQRARAEYERAVEQIELPEFVVTERGPRRAPR